MDSKNDFDASISTDSPSKFSKVLEILKWCLVIVMLTTCILALVYNSISFWIVKTYLEWMQNNIIIGLFAYFLLFCLWVVVCLPGSWLMSGISFVLANILPFWVAFTLSIIFSWIASATACTLAFLNGRYVMRSVVIWCIINATKRRKLKQLKQLQDKKNKSENQTNHTNETSIDNTTNNNNVYVGDTHNKNKNKNSARGTRKKQEKISLDKMIVILEKIVEKEGSKIVILLRINFLVPYSIINYGMSVTNMKFKYFIIGHFSIIIDAIVYCFIGTTIQQLTDVKNKGITSNTAVLIIVSIFIVLSTVGVAWILIVSTKKIKLLIEQESEKIMSNSQIPLQLKMQSLSTPPRSDSSMHMVPVPVDTPPHQEKEKDQQVPDIETDNKLQLDFVD